MASKKGKLSVAALSMLVVLSIGGSTVGTLAWYQYSTTRKADTPDYSVTADGGTLQFKNADGFWVSSLDNIDLEGLAKKNYTYQDNGIFSESPYAKAFSPVTSNDARRDAPLKGLYNAPVAGHVNKEGANAPAKRKDYLQFDMEVRNMAYQPGTNLPDHQIESDLRMYLNFEDRDTAKHSNASNALRVHISAGKTTDGLKGVYTNADTPNDTDGNSITLTLDGRGHCMLSEFPEEAYLYTANNTQEEGRIPSPSTEKVMSIQSR